PRLLFVFAAFAAVSGLAALLAIAPSGRRLTTGHVARHAESLISRLRESAAMRTIIPFFPGRPGRIDRPFRRLGRWALQEMREEIVLIMVAGFLFTFASSLFNTSYTPYMESVGISSAAIFLVNGGNNTAQGLFFPFSGAMAAREGSDRLVRQSTYFRSLGYLAMAGFTFLPVGIGIAFGGNLIVFASLGAAIALYSTASTLLLFRGLEGHGAGTLLGFNSALGGLAAVLGAGLSGLLSYYGSYRLTFLAAAGALLVSLPVWGAVEVAYGRRRKVTDSELPSPPWAPPPPAADRTIGAPGALPRPGAPPS
ncbi:MAG: MFS transporter, partial [Thermoplasmata archaeon]